VIAATTYRGRSAVLALFAGCFLLPVAPVQAKILIVKSDALPQYEAPIAAFRASINEEVEIINIEGSREKGERLLRTSAADGSVTGIFALGTQAAYLSKHVLPSVPMSFSMVLNWKRYEFAAPTTGVSVEIPVNVLFTRFRLLLPNVENIGLIYSEQVPEQTLAAARQAAATLGIDLVEEKVRYSDAVSGAYRRLRNSVDALWMLTDPVVVTRDNFRYLSDRCTKDDIAFLAFSENFVRAGALLSVSPDYKTMGSQAAVLLRKAIKTPSTPPAVQAPLGTTLVINSAVAEAIGVDLNAAVLSMADVVVGKQE
jgi:putative ABC transport system substrate-binding protein